VASSSNGDNVHPGTAVDSGVLLNW
jgi:hypothetical protein